MVRIHVNASKLLSAEIYVLILARKENTREERAASSLIFVDRTATTLLRNSLFQTSVLIHDAVPIRISFIFTGGEFNSVRVAHVDAIANDSHAIEIKN